MSEPAFLAKIASRREAAARIGALAGPVVFTNGVFDVLHRGHVTYLAQARALGAAWSSPSTPTLPPAAASGPDRPLNNETDRAIVMAALER